MAALFRDIVRGFRTATYLEQVMVRITYVGDCVSRARGNYPDNHCEFIGVFHSLWQVSSVAQGC